MNPTSTDEAKLFPGLDPAFKQDINQTLVKLARLLDEAIEIPGTNYRIGLDGLIGLIPVVGDLITVAFGWWMLQEGKRLGLPKTKLALMAVNYLLDVGVGFVPFVGDVWDFVFKANKMNLRMMEKHLKEMRGKARVVG